jgi:phosphoglycolate phosphatase
MIAIDLLIFDFDGTLVDTSKGIVAAVNHSLGKMGLPVRKPSEIIEGVGFGLDYLIERAIKSHDKNLVKAAVDHYLEYYRANACEQSFLYPHVREVLEFFSSKTKVIVSNKTARSMKMLLQALKVDMFFEDVLGGDDPTCTKPRSCPIDRMREKFPIKRQRTIMIGDMGVDIEAGKNAGVVTCGVTYGMGKKENLLNAHPDLLIGDIEELKTLLK